MVVSVILLSGPFTTVSSLHGNVPHFTHFYLFVLRVSFVGGLLPPPTTTISVFTSLQVACKTLSNLVRTSALTGITGAEGGGGSINIQGEEQKKLDIISNDIMKDALKWSGQLATLASEEEDTPVGIEVSAEEADFWGWGSDSVILDNTGRYVAVFDPLDGSSNVDAGIPVGTCVLLH